MAFLVKDRVLETTSAPGTGVVNLLGAVTGYQSFVSALVTTGTTTYYCIADQSGANWEVGLGTFTTTSGNQLNRTTVLSSSNGGSLTNFTTGTQNVFITYPSEEVVIVDPSGNTYAPNLGGTTPSAVTATNLTVNTSASLSPSGTVTVNPTTAGTINNMSVGATTPSTGAFTNFTASGTASFTSTGAVLLPSGTTAQEPASPVLGQIRFNTTTGQFEGYSQVGGVSGWYSVGGSAITNDTTSTTAYNPVFVRTTSGTAQTIYTSSTQYSFKPSTGALTAPQMNATLSTVASGNQGAFNYGTLSYSDTSILASYQSSVNSYNQMILQNTNNGATASTNFNVSNDSATATTNYGEFGINSSGFSGSGFSTAGWAYLASASTDLAIGTYGSNPIHFIVNNGSTDALTISTAGNVTTPNVLTGAEVVASNGLYLNASTINNSYTISSGNNAMSVGPITVASGKSVTVSSGQRWVVL